MDRARTSTVVGLAMASALAALAAGTGPATALPGAPGSIAEPPGRELLVDFTGAPVKRARPLGRLASPQHPFMAGREASNIHNDAYQTDSYTRGGPRGRDLQVSSFSDFAECASTTFDSRGRIVTVCVGVTDITLRLLNPETLEELDFLELPPRSPTEFGFDNFSGGGYFYLDHRDRAVVPTSDGRIEVVKVTESGFVARRGVDTSAVVGGSSIQSALPDWSNRLWFVTTDGAVGMVNRKGRIRKVELRNREVIANSFTIDESGGVFIVSDRALYRFDVKRGRPVISWRKTYDRGSSVKPGQVSQGSGTTPTLIGRASSRGGGSIAITDNADGRINVVVFRRGKAATGSRMLCKQPVFRRGRSSDENSLISVPGGLIAENNYGYTGPYTETQPNRAPTTEPGLVRIDVDYRRGGCEVAWRNDEIRIPTLVSKVSLANGLIYTYTHPAEDELEYVTPAPPDAVAPDAWYFTAVDARTGEVRWSKLTGTGLGYNNNYAPVTLGPDGTAYVGVIGGLLRIADGA